MNDKTTAKFVGARYLGSHRIETWVVEDLRDEEGVPCHGLAKFDEGKILLNGLDSERVRRQTELHEWLHWVEHVRHFDLKEWQVRAIEDGLAQGFPEWFR